MEAQKFQAGDFVTGHESDSRYTDGAVVIDVLGGVVILAVLKKLGSLKFGVHQVERDLASSLQPVPSKPPLISTKGIRAVYQKYRNVGFYNNNGGKAIKPLGEFIGLLAR